MTIAEKILAAHAGRKSVRPGEFINVKVDLVMAHDLTAGIAIQEFKKTGYEKVFDPEKVVLVMDQFTRRIIGFAVHAGPREQQGFFQR